MKKEMNNKKGKKRSKNISLKTISIIFLGVLIIAAFYVVYIKFFLGPNVTGRDIVASEKGYYITDSANDLESATSGNGFSETSQYVSKFIKWTEDTYGVFFAALFGVNTIDEYLFAKILLFLIIFAVSFMSLKRVAVFEERRSILFIISLCVSILAVRYLGPENFVRAILLPYGALGGAISIFLPLLIYFMFVHTSVTGGFGRRAAWFIYGVVFILLWATQEYMGTANWIYILGLGFIFINFLFDRSIHNYFELTALSAWRERVQDAHIARLQAEYQQIRNVNTMQADRRRREIERQLRRVNAHI